MDSFELNKIAGAVLGALLVGFGLSILSEIIFETEAPEYPGYVIAVAETGGGEGGEAAEEAVPFAALLANADPAAGEASFRKCGACHTAEEGGANKVGPNLYGVVGRPIASHAGYAYSDAMIAFSNNMQEVWDYDHLNNFIHDPKGTVPGTKMAFAGIRDDEERADVIAYLRTLAADPVPLPEVPAETAEAPAEGEAAPAEGEAAAAEATPAEGEAAPAQTEAPAAAEEAAQPAAAGEAAGPAATAGEAPAPAAAEGEAPAAAEPAATPATEAPAAPAVEGAAPAAPAATEAAPAAPAQPAAPAAPAGEATPPADAAPPPPPGQQGAAPAAGDDQAAAAGSPLQQEVAAADIAAGEAAARKCVACHSFEAGGPNKVGPNLHDVVGRIIASHEGYNYSDAMQEFSEGGTKVWDLATLDPYLADPRGTVPGTKMVFAGLKREDERHAVLAYLQSLSQ